MICFEEAVEIASELGRPLLVLEALRLDYPWSSERFHAFALQGMADNAKRFASTPIRYHAYVEPEPGHGRGLLETLAEDAHAVVTDDLCWRAEREARDTVWRQRRNSARAAARAGRCR